VRLDGHGVGGRPSAGLGRQGGVGLEGQPPRRFGCPRTCRTGASWTRAPGTSRTSPPAVIRTAEPPARQCRSQLPQRRADPRRSRAATPTRYAVFSGPRCSGDRWPALRPVSAGVLAAARRPHGDAPILHGCLFAPSPQRPRHQPVVQDGPHRPVRVGIVGPAVGPRRALRPSAARVWAACLAAGTLRGDTPAVHRRHTGLSAGAACLSDPVDPA
jgi:hypothetical protein